jgi:hypothetical protein
VLTGYVQETVNIFLHLLWNLTPDLRDVLQEHTHLYKSTDEGSRHEQQHKLFLKLQRGFFCKATLVTSYS